ncbi:MAG: hypothetical protein CMJ48_00455 [Planctomycetaceae bacterium]|nr:hypothetical protein [Planctomycetaceae bacterium]
MPVANSTPFERESWIRVIEDRSELIPAQPLPGIPNPFKPGETMTVSPDPAHASLVIDQLEVGSFSWAMNDETLINVHGNLNDVRSFAVELAEFLGGVFVPERP